MSVSPPLMSRTLLVSTFEAALIDLYFGSSGEARMFSPILRTV